MICSKARRVTLAVLLVLVARLSMNSATRATTQQPDPPSDAGRFGTVELFVDPRGQSLAAYQVEFVADPQRVTLVGVEGGEHPAFKEPPYYDPKALAGNRVILAALSTGADLPSARTRVATLHVRITGRRDDAPDWSAKLEAAGNPQGQAIPADVSVSAGAGANPEGVK